MANKTPSTGGQSAPAITTAPVYQAPVRRKTIERQGGTSSPQVARWPLVRGGVCDYCGVLDRNIQYERTGIHQYELCPHFRDIGKIACSYCPVTKDPGEVIGHSKMIVSSHPDNPDRLVVVCDAYSCAKAHEDRFQVSLR